MIAALVFALVGARLSTTELTFVRHGETQANATGHYNSRSVNALSDRGQREVAALPSKLSDRYDLILVSPSPRALHTILPYLRRTHQRAFVWPLLYECCTQRRPAGAHPTSFAYGAPFRLPADSKDVFQVLPGEERLPVANDYNSGLAQVAAAASEFRSRFMKSSVLMVGHSGEGGHMIHELTGRWIKLDNAKPIRLAISSEDRGPSRRSRPN